MRKFFSAAHTRSATAGSAAGAPGDGKDATSDGKTRPAGPPPLKRQRSSIFEMLDIDVHVNVFLFLNIREIVRLSCVSKEYRRLIGSGRIWRALIAQTFEPGTRSLCTAMAAAERGGRRRVNWRTVFLEMRVMFELKEVMWRSDRLISRRLPYNSGREMSACVMMGSKCVAVAGWCNRGPCNDIMVLECKGLENPEGPQRRLEWRQAMGSGDARLPRVYGHTATLISPDTILVFGGMCRGGYNGILNIVRTLTHRPAAETSEDGDAKSHSDVPPSERNALNDEEWVWAAPELANEPPHRGFHAAAFIPANAPGLPDWKQNHPCGVLAVHGGNGARGPCGDLFFLDIKTWSFAQVEARGSAPAARNAHRMLYSASQGVARLYVFGGGNGHGVPRGGRDFDDGYVLELKSMQWRQLRFQHSPGDTRRVLGRGVSCMMLDEGHLLFFGGHHYHNPEPEEEMRDGWMAGIGFSDNLRLLDLATMKWRYPKRQRGPVPAPRAYHVCGVYGTHMVFMGGWRDGEYLSDSSVLSMSPQKWVAESAYDAKLAAEEVPSEGLEQAGGGALGMSVRQAILAMLSRATFGAER